MLIGCVDFVFCFRAQNLGERCKSRAPDNAEHFKAQAQLLEDFYKSKIEGVAGNVGVDDFKSTEDLVEFAAYQEITGLKNPPHLVEKLIKLLPIEICISTEVDSKGKFESMLGAFVVACKEVRLIIS